MQSTFFGLSAEALLAGLTGLFVVAAIMLYARSILKEKSRPHAAAWLVRLGLCVIAFASQSAQGATYSLALSGTQVVSAVVILGLCFRRGSGWQPLARTDWLALLTAGCGVAVWAVSGNALFGLFGTMLADASATIIGIRSALLHHREESAAFWTCAGLAASCALAVTVKQPALLLAPLFSCANASANLLTIWYVRQRRLQRPSLLAETD